ncbi:FAD-dependent oxidoreductase [Vibrio sp.]|nr:FAD-dependent oxidoreductase [Vibrio sp.]
MNIAIIGSGISGLTCGYHLCKEHTITVFEANDYIGGHTATVDVDVKGKSYSVDTGFIVYNDRTYPNFIKMLDSVGIQGTPTEMSFSVANQTNGLEYNGHNLQTLFAQKRNWLNPRFYSFIFEILKFNKLAKNNANSQDSSIDSQTLGDFLVQHSFSDYFSDNYILPMGAAIWSSTLADMRAFPLRFFLQFFLNHGLLDIKNRPQWYVIPGGSRSYIPKITQHFSDRIRLNSPVETVERFDDHVLITVNGESQRFDHVVFACHSDQALSLLKEPTAEEVCLLSKMAYQSNEVTLHLDTSMLPKRQKAWAAWNYKIMGGAGEHESPPILTYDMNILQHIQSDHTFCVSLNSREYIDPNKVLRTFQYSHPVFNSESIQAQQHKSLINGLNRTWFCGAYWRNGFHEDGVVSALDVVKGLKANNLEVNADTMAS